MSSQHRVDPSGRLFDQFSGWHQFPAWCDHFILYRSLYTSVQNFFSCHCSCGPWPCSFDIPSDSVMRSFSASAFRNFEITITGLSREAGSSFRFMMRLISLDILELCWEPCMFWLFDISHDSWYMRFYEIIWVCAYIIIDIYIYIWVRWSFVSCHARIWCLLYMCLLNVKPKNQHSKSFFTYLGNLRKLCAMSIGQALYYVYCAAEDDELLDGCWQRNSTYSPSCGNNEALSIHTLNCIDSKFDIFKACYVATWADGQAYFHVLSNFLSHP